jgi:multiple sugar transport system ATP-binding protein
MAQVEFCDVSKAFGALEILRQISTVVADGEFAVLVGPSGCGKSTLLRLLAGLETITSGQILIAGKVVNDVAPSARDIAMVFQNYALYPHMSVAQNMGFSLKLKGTPQSEIGKVIAEAAGILGIEALLGRYPRELSGGQRQRVAMGRAIVRRPQVFLFDEPLSNLDAKLRVQMRTDIKALHKRLNATTLYVTHDQVEAMTMADRIVVLRNGQIEQQGSPLELYDRPANVFVATFIGSSGMNLIRAEAGESGAQLNLGPDAVLHLSTAARPGAALTVGVRPEHVSIASEAGLPFAVDVVEHLGAEIHAHGRLFEQPFVAVFRDRVNVSAGDRIRLAFDTTRVHVFDTATGVRV